MDTGPLCNTLEYSETFIEHAIAALQNPDHPEHAVYAKHFVILAGKLFKKPDRHGEYIDVLELD